MTDERLNVLLLQARDVADEITVFVRVTSREDFDTDVMKERGITLSLMIIGELMGKIQGSHPEFVAAHPDVPWAEIRGLRNRIARGYFDVRREVIWKTATVAIPSLMAALRDAIPPHSGS